MVRRDAVHRPRRRRDLQLDPRRRGRELHRLPALHRLDHRTGRHDARLDDDAADGRPAVPAVHLHPARARPGPVRGQGRLPDVEGLPGHDRHRPVRARRMAARRLLADGGQPRLLAGRSEDRRARVPRLPERRGDDPGPRAGGDRFRLLDRERGPLRLAGRRPRRDPARRRARLLRPDELQPVHGRGPVLQEDRLQLPPRAQGSAAASRGRVRDRSADARRSREPGVRRRPERRS